MSNDIDKDYPPQNPSTIADRIDDQAKDGEFVDTKEKELTTDLSRVSGDVNRTGTTFPISMDEYWQRIRHEVRKNKISGRK
jgi:hypothetical protein